MDDSYYKCKCLTDTLSSPFHTLLVATLLGIIPNIPCLLHNSHLLEPVTIIHLDRVHVRLIQPLQCLHYPSLAIPVCPSLLNRNKREMRLESPQIFWGHPSDNVTTPLICLPLGMTVIDDVLGKVPGLEATTDLVKVTNAPPRRGGDKYRPVVKSIPTIRAVSSGKLRNPDREVAGRDLVPVMHNTILRSRCRPKAHGVGCGAGSARCHSGEVE